MAEIKKEVIEDDRSSADGRNGVSPDVVDFNEYDNNLCLKQFLETEITIVKNEIDELLEQQAGTNKSNDADLSKQCNKDENTVSDKNDVDSHIKMYVVWL